MTCLAAIQSVVDKCLCPCTSLVSGICWLPHSGLRDAAQDGAHRVVLAGLIAVSCTISYVAFGRFAFADMQRRCFLHSLRLGVTRYGMVEERSHTQQAAWSPGSTASAPYVLPPQCPGAASTPSELPPSASTALIDSQPACHSHHLTDFGTYMRTPPGAAIVHCCTIRQRASDCSRARHCTAAICYCWQLAHAGMYRTTAMRSTSLSRTWACSLGQYGVTSSPRSRTEIISLTRGSMLADIATRCARHR